MMKQSERRRSLVDTVGSPVVLAFVLGLTLVVGGLLFQAHVTTAAAREDLERSFQSDIVTLAESIATLPEANRARAANAIANSFLLRADVDHVIFSGPGLTVDLAKKLPNAAAAPDWFLRWCGVETRSGRREVTMEGQKIGSLYVEESTRTTAELAWHSTVTALYVALLGLAAAMVVIRIAMGRNRRHALRESEAPYFSLIESSSVGIVRLDQDGNVTFCNDVLTRMMGIGSGTAWDHWVNRNHPDDAGRQLADILVRTRQGGALSKATLKYTNARGEESWAELRLLPLNDAKGRFLGFVGTVTDISDERRSRSRMRHLSSLYATLSHVNSAIVHCTDASTLYDQICRIGVEQGQFSIVCSAVVDPMANTATIVSTCGAEADTLFRSSASGSREANGDACPAFILNMLDNGRIGVYNAPGGDAPSLFPVPLAWNTTGVRSWACVPIRRFGKTIAAIAFGSEVADYFSDEILSLIEEIGQDVSFAMENLERELQRRIAEEQLQVKEERLRLALNVSSIGLKEVNLRTRRVWLDEMASSILGIGERETTLDMRDYLLLSFPGVDHAEIDRLGNDISAGNTHGYAYERPFTRPDGAVRWLRTRGGAAVTSYARGDDQILLSVMVDVTEQHAQAEREQLAMAMFTNSREAILITDADAKLLMINQAFIDQTGYGNEMIGRSLRTLGSSLHSSSFYEQLWADLVSRGHWEGEVWNRRKNGKAYPIMLYLSTVRNAEGIATHFIGQATDISQHKEFQERITYLAYRDSLTDLPNRTLLRDRVEQAIASAQRDGTSLALLFVDLDHFKTINDSLGHSVGDLLLRQVAMRVTALVREMDTVGRLGGDEFLLLLPGVGTDIAAHIAQKLIDEIARPIPVDDVSLTVTPSIGIAMFPRDGATYDNLLKAADTAMYTAKGEGRNRYWFFTPEMNERVLRRLMLEGRLRQAIELNEFLLYYQPQFDIPSRTLIGAEALIRWRDPQLGFVSPGEFIPVAEDSGLIVQVGAWVIDEACRQIKTWLDTGHQTPRISINVSTRQFATNDLAHTFDQSLSRHRLKGSALEVEITESLLAGSMDLTLTTLQVLRNRGINAAIDDFGTGYSSLSYLKRFPINRLKIDQSFVRELENDADARAIAMAVVTLGHSLGMRVIAEGVETEQQFDILERIGCDEAQGYYLGRPLPADEFSGLLPR